MKAVVCPTNSPACKVCSSFESSFFSDMISYPKKKNAEAAVFEFYADLELIAYRKNPPQPAEISDSCLHVTGAAPGNSCDRFAQFRSIPLT